MPACQEGSASRHCTPGPARVHLPEVTRGVAVAIGVAVGVGVVVAVAVGIAVAVAVLLAEAVAVSNSRIARGVGVHPGQVRGIILGTQLCRGGGKGPGAGPCSKLPAQ